MSNAAAITSLATFSANLRRLPRVVAQKVALAAAPKLTDAVMATFNASQSADGTPWQPGADGQRVTLQKSGALASKIRYVAVGTRLRVALGVAHAKYQVGRRPLFPKQGDPLPASYVKVLEDATAAVCRVELGQ